MRITPLDVRKQDFKRSMRGFDADEVRAFLTTLADEYEAVLVDNKQLRERVLEQDEKLAEYRNLERTLRDTLMTAERVTQEARETAQKQGELLVGEARQKVERVLAEGRARLEDLRRESLALHREKETFLGRFRSLAEAQIQFVEAHRSDFKALDSRLLDPVEPSYGPETDRAGHQPLTSFEAQTGLHQTGEDAASPPRGPAAAHLDQLHDQWRDYAIEREAAATAAAIERAAAAAEAPSEVPTAATPQPEAAPAETPLVEDPSRL